MGGSNYPITGSKQPESPRVCQILGMYNKDPGHPVFLPRQEEPPRARVLWAWTRFRSGFLRTQH